MKNDSPPLFGKTRYLEAQIDEFLDKVSEGGIFFERGMSALVEHGVVDETREKLAQLIHLKERCNELRRGIVNTLYTEMLVPDFRGDILRLLSELYGLLDLIKNSFQEFLIEYLGMISQNSEYQYQIKDLVDVVNKSIQASVMGARSFFRNPQAVRDYVNQIRIYESEADAITLRIKTALFASDRSLERKLLAREALTLIDSLADRAEEISDELSILAIKRVV